MFEKKYEVSSWFLFWMGFIATTIGSINIFLSITTRHIEKRDEILDKIKSKFKKD